MYRFTEEHPLHRDDVQGIQHLYGEGMGRDRGRRGRARFCRLWNTRRIGRSGS